MQYMDPEGRTAAIKFLKNMNKETLIIIEHGLAEMSRRPMFLNKY